MIAPGRNKPKIRAPRRGLNQAADVDFDNTWNTLAAAFTEIHSKNASKLSFEELYRNAYKLVLKKKGEDLYNRVSNFEKEWLSNHVKTSIYRLISNTILLDDESTSKSTVERRVAGERYLQGLRQSWQDHQTCMSMLTDVLMYMDRVYCSDTHQPSIFTKAMSLFRDEILRAEIKVQETYRSFLEILNSVILDQIRMDRDGDFIDKHLIKSNVYMLESLYDGDLEAEENRLYLREFEPRFLETSAQFYREEGDRLLKESDAGTYCRHAKRRIVEEQDRCRSTLSEHTSPKIQTVVEDELIRNKMKGLIEMDSGVQFMVNNERLNDLGLVFELEARVDARKTELTKALQKIITEMGTNVNNAAIAASTAQPAPTGEGEDKDKAKGPGERVVNQQTVAALKWVEEVLELKDQFDNIWKVSFQEDQVLQTALTRSTSDVINAFNRSAEYISLFIDDNMKKGIKGKNEDEVDAVLDKAITLLRYLQDKDVFETYYKKHLCKRLLMNRSLSIDVEKQMISRMKIELGNSFTVKLEAMFKDMTLSEELTAGYKSHVAGLGEADPKRIDLSLNVLTSMTWPLETMHGVDNAESDKRMKTIYPPAIEKIKTGFEMYYKTKYNGRVLTWQGNMGTADIKATFPKVPSKDGPPRARTHELNVSTYAMIILLLFNDLPPGGSLTFEEIQAKTNIPPNELVRNLQSLAVAPKTRILLKEPMSKDVKPSDRFVFNEGFQGRFVKIKVGVVSAGNRVESDRERRETERKSNDSRGFVVEAAVVRIMKQRKELSHAELLSETISQLTSQFKPDVNMIKKRIESLIEREYLERIEEAATPSYRYLA